MRMVGQEAAPRKCVLLSTSRRVRTEMAGWISLFCARELMASCARAPVVCAFPLDFEGVSFGFFVPCLSLLLCVVLRLALYQSGVLVGFVRLSFVLPGLVFCLSLILELSSPLLDGPLGSDPAFHVVSA